MNQLGYDVLKQNWKNICYSYLQEFCERHDYRFEPDMWVSNNPGTVAMIEDMYVDMEVIRFDVDNQVDTQLFEKWYWKSLELYELGVKNWMNYESYCNGCPDEWTEERIDVLRKAKERVESAQKALDDMLEKYSKQPEQPNF
jgi:hypothetical protein